MRRAGPARDLAPLITRRRLQVALGLLWLFDGALQAQPHLFTSEFFGMMLRMGPAEPPGWLWDLGSRIEPVVTAHAVLANALFAVVQILVGAGLLWRRTIRVALAVSVPWAIAVWLFGEAAGGLFSPGASALTGAPGAALLYAVLALLLWPHADDGLATVAYSGALRPPLPDLFWVALWLGTAALELETLNYLPLIPGGVIANAANGGATWLVAINHGVGALVGQHGLLFAISAGLAQASIGLGILVPRIRSAALTAGMALAMFYGLVGQDLGGIFSGGLDVFASGATDPGTGPVVVLMALVLWPRQMFANAVGARNPQANVPTLAPSSVLTPWFRRPGTTPLRPSVRRDL